MFSHSAATCTDRQTDDSGPRSGSPSNETRELFNQLVLVGTAVFLYFAVRGVTQGDDIAAVANGLNVLGFEESIGLNIEATLQSTVLDNPRILTTINWIYIWGHWPVITATLIWLHRTSRNEYVLLRNAMFASGAIGLVIFTFYPVAPPRLLDVGMTDTVTTLSNSYRVLQPPSLVNKYAALPSLHVGWNLLIGIFIWRVTSMRATRWLGALSPLAMITAVVLTANHYIIDAVAGATVALVGLWIARQITKPKPKRNKPAAHQHRRQRFIDVSSAPETDPNTTIPGQRGVEHSGHLVCCRSDQ